MGAARDRFDGLYAEHLPSVLGYAVRRCTQPADAADVVAETFLTLWRRLADVPAGRERVWLFGVARRILANQRRGEVRRSMLADQLRADLLVRCPVVVDDPGDTVTQALARLSERDRELLTLVAWDGLGPADIAELEGVPAATVRSQLLRARHRLRVLLACDVAESRS